MPAPRRAPGHGRAVPARAARGGGARAPRRARRVAREPFRGAGSRCSSRRSCWPTYVDGISNLAHKIVDLTDAQALVCLVEMDGRVFCVEPRARARARRCRGRGGARRRRPPAGGLGRLTAGRWRRRGSSSSTRSPAPRGRLPTAAEIMSRPARFVAPDETVAQAMVLCQRHRQSGILVEDDERLVGLVTREDLDQAIGHDLSHAPGEERHELRRRHVRGGARRSPELTRLLRDLGRGPRAPSSAATRSSASSPRSDLLRALGEPTAEEAAPAGPDLSAQLLAITCAQTRLRGHRRRSREGFDGVYLVGGAVRDLLMDEPSFDVDIAVEGDGIAFGRALAAGARRPRRPARQVRHRDRPLRRRQGRRRDVADRVLRLPRLRCPRSSRRRSGRTSTAATSRSTRWRVSLKGEDFGRLVDSFGGLRRPRGEASSASSTTSRSSTTRHASSAPSATRTATASAWTRTRFGLARACIEMELVGELSSARLRDELQALLSEAEVGDSLRRMAELGVDQAIHPHLAAGEDAVELVAELDALRERYAPDAPAWRLRLAALARRLPPDELYDWFERLKLRRRDARAHRRRGHRGRAAARARRGHGRARQAAGGGRAARSRRRAHGHGRAPTRRLARASSATSRSSGTSSWRSRAGTSPSSA